MLGWATADEIAQMNALTHRVNAVLKPLFANAGIDLVDYKLEFGHPADDPDGPLVLGDEFTPDGCRLWDAKTGEKLDKDRFRRDLGEVIEHYREAGGGSALRCKCGVRDRVRDDFPTFTLTLHLQPQDRARHARFARFPDLVEALDQRLRPFGAADR